MTAFVTYHGSETLEDTYRRSDGDELGYEIPVGLIARLEDAKKVCDEAVEAIRRYIESNRVPEIELDEP
jgi:hypothetical protein